METDSDIPAEAGRVPFPPQPCSEGGSLPRPGKGAGVKAASCLLRTSPTLQLSPFGWMDRQWIEEFVVAHGVRLRPRLCICTMHVSP